MTYVVGPQSQGPEMVQHAIDSYLASERASQQNKIQQQQVNQEGAFQGAQVQDLRDRLAAAKEAIGYQRMEQWAKDTTQTLMNLNDTLKAPNTDPATKQWAQTQLDQIKSSFTPEQQNAMKIRGVDAALMTPQRQAGVNVADTSRTYSGQAAAAAQPGGQQNPYASSYTWSLAHPNMPQPAEATKITEAQALDQSRAAGQPTPSPTATVPKPSTSDVSNLYSRDTGGLTTAGQNQLAQTDIQKTAMQTAGEADVRKAQAAQIRAATPAAGAMAGGAGATGDAFLQTLSPDMRALIQQVGNYQRDITSVASFRGRTLGPSERLQISQMVAQAFPDYDQKNYVAAQKFLNAYTSGSEAATKTTIDRAALHLKQLDDLIPKVNNSAFQPYNWAANKGAAAIDNPAIKDYERVALPVASEIAKLMKTGQGSVAAPSEEEIRNWTDKFNVNSGPKTQKSSIVSALDIISAPIAAAVGKWNSISGGRPMPVAIINPQTAAIFKSYGISEIGGVPVDELAKGGGPVVPGGGGGGQPGGGVISTPDGLRWRKNPDGSMTQVQ